MEDEVHSRTKIIEYLETEENITREKLSSKLFNLNTVLLALFVAFLSFGSAKIFYLVLLFISVVTLTLLIGSDYVLYKFLITIRRKIMLKQTVTKEEILADMNLNSRLSNIAVFGTALQLIGVLLSNLL